MNNSELQFSEEELFTSLMTEINQINDYIYLGNQTAAGYSPSFEGDEAKIVSAENAKRNLQNLGIKSILCCADDIKVLENDFQHLCLPLKDMPGFQIKDYFEQAYNFIEDEINKENKILLHCNAGATRSATITISYLMKKYGLKFNEAHVLVKKKRPCINVKIFIDDLKTLE
jgi:protein-tyrosine phosphatase